MRVSTLNTPRSSTPPIGQQHSQAGEDPDSLYADIWNTLQEPLPNHKQRSRVSYQQQAQQLLQPHTSLRQQPLHLAAGLAPTFEPQQAPRLKDRRLLQERITTLVHKAELVKATLSSSRDSFSHALELLRGGSLDVRDLLAQPELMRGGPEADHMILERASESIR
jgi:hypothetical protein